MAGTRGVGGWQRVENERVWHHTKVIFLGSLLVFLINIALGFGNVLTPGEIPHWQILTHFHAATIGWISLSAIGFTVWLFTGNRDVSETYERRIKWLAGAGVLFATGYVLSFGISFSLTGNTFALMPIFGTGTMLVFWATALLALTQLRQQPTLRTVHLLVASGFVVASFGALMGVLIGLQHAIGTLSLPLGIPQVSNHAGTMDAYAAIIGLALVEWLVDRDDVRHRSWHGILQVVLVLLWGLLSVVPIEAISQMGIFPGLLAVGVFLVRVGWRAVATNPLRFDESTWATFAPLWLLVFIGGFLGFSAGVIPLTADTIGPIVFHAYFVGLITNGLFGMLSARTRDGPRLHEYAEPAAFWLINLGLVAFAATKIAYGGREGAIIMGIGILLGVALIGNRLVGGSGTAGATGGAGGAEVS